MIHRHGYIANSEMKLIMLDEWLQVRHFIKHCPNILEALVTVSKGHTIKVIYSNINEVS